MNTDDKLDLLFNRLGKRLEGKLGQWPLIFLRLGTIGLIDLAAYLIASQAIGAPSFVSELLLYAIMMFTVFYLAYSVLIVMVVVTNEEKAHVLDRMFCKQAKFISLVVFVPFVVWAFPNSTAYIAYERGNLKILQCCHFIAELGLILVLTAMFRNNWKYGRTRLSVLFVMHVVVGLAYLSLVIAIPLQVFVMGLGQPNSAP